MQEKLQKLLKVFISDKDLSTPWVLQQAPSPQKISKLKGHCNKELTHAEQEKLHFHSCISCLQHTPHVGRLTDLLGYTGGTEGQKQAFGSGKYYSKLPVYAAESFKLFTSLVRGCMPLSQHP